MEKTKFEIVEDGTKYNLPTYEVIDGKGIDLTGEVLALQFVRGSKLKGEDVPKVNGILHETLISMMIHDLTFKNGLVPSKDTNYTLQCLDEALISMQKRSKERSDRKVEGTYAK